MNERQRIEAITSRLKNRGARLRRWTGDDAAVVEAGRFAVVSVDGAVDGVHFRRDYATPWQIGWKAAAAALSDLAAMGVAAGELYVALGLPDDVDDAELLELCDGIEAAAAHAGATVAGGDLNASATLWLSVTVTGWTDEEGVVGRDGARAGELLAITGSVGAAAAGLALLTGRVGGERLAAAGTALRRRQLEPSPLLAAGRALAAAGVTAMIDVSDGVARDAANLAGASGCGVRVALAELPLADGVDAVAAELAVDAAEFAAAGGEDYELLCTLPEQLLEPARAAAGGAGTRLTVIGAITGGHGVELVAADGGRRSLDGFEHFDS